MSKLSNVPDATLTIQDSLAQLEQIDRSTKEGQIQYERVLRPLVALYGEQCLSERMDDVVASVLAHEGDKGHALLENVREWFHGGAFVRYLREYVAGTYGTAPTVQQNHWQQAQQSA